MDSILFYHSQCLVVTSTDVASTWNMPLGIFLRKFLVWVEWGEAIHSKYGWDYSICWGPGNKCEKVSWAPTRVCPSASWLCAQCDELHAPATDFPTVVDCPPKLWDINLSLFPHVSDLATATIKISTTSFNLLYICSYLYRDYYRALNIFKIPCFLWYILIHLAN